MKRVLIALQLAHSWYPTMCCENNHCHPVPCAEIQVNGDGYKYTGEWAPGGVVFEKGQVKPSQDAECHVCIVQTALKTLNGVCIFIPQGDV